MAEASEIPLFKTPLHARHLLHGARMVPFGGWDMPVEYGGLSDEHNAVRTRAGLFDVSHMGEVEIAGDDALAAVQRISSNDASKLSATRGVRCASPARASAPVPDRAARSRSTA